MNPSLLQTRIPAAAPERTAYAAFVKESRIKCAKATSCTGNPGKPLPCKAYHDESLIKFAAN